MAKKDPYKAALTTALASVRVTSVDFAAQIRWINGEPHLVNAPVQLSGSPDSSLRALMIKALDLPYDGWDKSLKGVSQGAAIVLNMVRQAAEGDSTARAELLDRLMGKSVSISKNLNVSGSLEDFLDQVAKETRTEVVDLPVTVMATPEVDDL